VRFWAGIASGIVAVTALGACGSSSTTALKVGVIDYDISVIGAQREDNAVSQAMQKIGWSVTQENGASNASSANLICQTFLSEKFQVIISDVWSTAQMTQCLTSAASTGVPVFMLASALGTGAAGAINTSVVTDVNTAFINAVKKATNPQILALEGSAGLPCLQRQQEMDKLRQAAGIPDSVVTRHELNSAALGTDAEATTTAWLEAHPVALGQSLFIWTCTTLASEGSYAALQELGRTVPMYAWDLTTADVPELESGALVETSISNTTVLGQQLVGMVQRWQKNHKATPEQLFATALVLTQSNIAHYAATNTITPG
jgi:ABC-type sugar transport system substrate-binding protein